MYRRMFIHIVLVMIGFIFTIYSDSPADDLAGASTNLENGTIFGQFKINPKTPLSNGRLFVYDKASGKPSADRYVRVPDHLAGLDEDGRFTLELTPGIYYLSAVKPTEDGSIGPPHEGEPIYFKKDKKSGIQAFTVTAGKKTDAGIVMTSYPYKRNPDSQNREATTIQGIVSDADGVPVEGAVILVYLSPDILDKANFVSEKTAKDGKFSLRVTDGGNYYLRVRGDYGGGAPKEGEIVNIKDPKELQSVFLKKGETLKGVAIQIKKQQRGPLYQGNGVPPQ